MNRLRLRWLRFTVLSLLGCIVHNVALAQDAASWVSANPIVPIPDPPLGIGTDENMPAKLTEFDDPPTPERVRRIKIDDLKAA